MVRDTKPYSTLQPTLRPDPTDLPDNPIALPYKYLLSHTHIFLMVKYEYLIGENMRFSKYRCTRCGKELRSNNTKVMGICSGCKKEGKLAISFNKMKANPLPKNLLAPYPRQIPPKALRLPQDPSQILQRTPCQKCGELDYLWSMNDGLCINCRLFNK